MSLNIFKNESIVADGRNDPEVIKETDPPSEPEDAQHINLENTLQEVRQHINRIIEMTNGPLSDNKKNKQIRPRLNSTHRVKQNSR